MFEKIISSKEKQVSFNKDIAKEIVELALVSLIDKTRGYNKEEILGSLQNNNENMNSMIRFFIAKQTVDFLIADGMSINNALLFGSVNQGRAGFYSDIDIGLKVAEQKNKRMEFLKNLNYCITQQFYGLFDKSFRNGLFDFKVFTVQEAGIHYHSNPFVMQDTYQLFPIY